MVNGVEKGQVGEKLPKGWKWVRLGDVCETSSENRDPRREPNKPFHYVDIASIDNASKQILDFKTLLGKDAPSRARQVIRTENVIVSTTRPNLNAVALVPQALENQICSTGFCVLRSSKAIEPIYLFNFVQSGEFVQSLSNLVKGALYPAVTDRQVLDQLIPLPPLPEQKRIVAILTDRLSTIDKARTATEAQLKAAKALPAAYLREVFDRSEAQKWERKKLGEVAEIVAPQVDPKIPEYGELPHVNGENIESGTAQLLYLNTAKQEGMTSGKYMFDAGDVLYSKLRPYLRKVVLVDFKGLCSADMYPIKFDPRWLNSEFAVWLLLSDKFTSYANEASARSRMPKLNREQLFEWETSIPPLKKQKEVAAFINQHREATNNLIDALQSQLTTINELPAALLRQAFNGEL